MIATERWAATAPTDATNTGDGAISLRERKRLLDAVWLLTFCVTVVAAALPWFLRSTGLDFAPVAWAAFLAAGLYLTGATLTDRLANRRTLGVAVWILQIVALMLLTLLWHLLGGAQNPLFLLPFVLPVAASGFVLIPWLPYVSAAVAIAAVSAVTLADAAELRWYLQQLGLPAAAGGDFYPALPAVADPFPAAYLPPAFLFSTLVVFAVVLLAVAVVADSLGTLLARLYQRISSSSQALEQTAGLFEKVLEASPAPAVLVHADNAQVARASGSFLRRMGLAEADLASRNLFDLIDFAAPEEVAALLGKGGEIAAIPYRAAGEDRLTRVRIEQVEHDGTRYAYVSLQELGGGFYLEAAVKAAREAIVVLDPRERLVFFNPAAEDLLGPLAADSPATAALARPELPAAWWRTTPAAVEIAGRRFRLELYNPSPATGLLVLVLRPEPEA